MCLRSSRSAKITRSQNELAGELLIGFELYGPNERDPLGRNIGTIRPDLSLKVEKVSVQTLFACGPVVCSAEFETVRSRHFLILGRLALLRYRCLESAAAI